MALGPRDKSSLGLLTGWDATELKKFDLQDGTTIQAIAGMLNSAVGSLQAELTSGLWGGLISVTEQPDVEYRVGVSNGFELHTEYGRPDAKRASTEGHMLPLLSFDRGLGWTWDYLEEARGEQIQADIADAAKDARDIWRQKILTRVLQRGDDSGANKGLGTGGYSPGFATAAASTSVDFTPPAYGGTSFDSDHEHYVGISGGAFTAAVFTDAKAELREHGLEPPYNFLIGTADESTVIGLTGFVPIAKSNINYASTTSLATVDGMADTNGTYAVGVIDDFIIYVVRGMPQYYGFGYKSFGNMSQRNPLRVRVPKGFGGLRVEVANDPRNGSPAHPLQYLMLKMRFGVGVADRTNGTARYTNSATWADGTAT